MSKGKWKILVCIGIVLGVGLLAFPGRAAFIRFVYPSETDVRVSRSFEPAEFSSIENGGVITVTVDVVNNEDTPLHGFYCSDQVPSGWEVETIGVSVEGTSIEDYDYEQGSADDIYTGLTPHRWALEVPQGDGVFSPTHPITASGGTAQVIYRMIVNGGTGSDYSAERDAWAGWLDTSPTGTAVFGYQKVVETLRADFEAEPRSGLAPLAVAFTDTSTGGASAWAWDFGDGDAVSFQQHPTYTYDLPGNYTVTLTVTRTEPVSSAAVIKPNLITVARPSLRADFEAEPRSGLAPLAVTFTDTSIGDVLTRAWDFGDGGTAHLPGTAVWPHTYTYSGHFTVSLTVQDAYTSSTEVKRSFIRVTEVVCTVYLPVILRD